MTLVWDVKADIVKEGDNLRDIYPLKRYKDKLGLEHYVFSKEIFHNPKYIIPDDDFTLFYNFLNGGSREYPSDGNIPVDIVAEEAGTVLGKIKEIAEKSNHKFHSSAKKLLINGESELVRGTIKLYLGEYTTGDWRRKRSTNDIDFWISDKCLLENILSKTNWKKNKKTRKWEKKVAWKDPWTGTTKSSILIASDDIEQKLDFGSGSSIEGQTIKDIIKKKIVRGHDVDLSDIINVAIVNNIPKSNDTNSPWRAIVEGSNMRHPRTNSNLISLCRYSYGIADYLRMVGKSIKKFKDLVIDKSKYSDGDIIRICKCSSHWLKNHFTGEVSATRNRIYNNLIKQERKKIQYSNNLHNFAGRVLELLNSKYDGIIFEIKEDT